MGRVFYDTEDADYGEENQWDCDPEKLGSKRPRLINMAYQPNLRHFSDANIGRIRRFVIDQQ